MQLGHIVELKTKENGTNPKLIFSLDRKVKLKKFKIEEKLKIRNGNKRKGKTEKCCKRGNLN